MGIAGDNSTAFAPSRETDSGADGKPLVQVHTARLGNKIQTFSADFTTARTEDTDRNGMVEVYSDGRIDG